MHGGLHHAAVDVDVAELVVERGQLRVGAVRRGLGTERKRTKGPVSVLVFLSFFALSLVVTCWRNLCWGLSCLRHARRVPGGGGQRHEGGGDGGDLQDDDHDNWTRSSLCVLPFP